MATLPAWYFFTKQTEWQAYIKHLVTNNDDALFKAIVCIDNMQTELERLNKQSTEDNNVGWTKVDADVMCTIAQKIKAGQQLSAGEVAKSRNKMKKYWKQLMDVGKQHIAEYNAKQQYQQMHKTPKPTPEQVNQIFDDIKRCSEEGIACGYGICSECPLTHGWQLKLDIS